MVIVNAKLKVKSKTFEVSVDFDEAMKVQRKEGDITRALNSSNIFYNAKEGSLASQKDLMEAFGTADTHAIAKIIIQRGELQKPQEFRDAERENKIKQVITLLIRNAVDQHGRPYTEDRLKRAIQEVHFNFDNSPAERQMPELLEKLKMVIPIRVETKRIKIIIPARFSGQVYGLLKDYKESEEWLSNGDLQAIMNVPAGMQLDFYEKLNNITHGAVVSEDLGEK
ncbi:MAG: ribosome assembly factor SBDS [Nanoarchaeota archaeon]